MSKNISINVNYLTRVEGHGNIVVEVKDGKLEVCRLEIVESPRFFEAFLRGRSIYEAPHITCRICGICSCGHTLASIQAAEDALEIKPTEQTTLLRKLLLHYEQLDSHILHIYLLVAPDLVGVPSFVPLIKSNPDVVRRALRMKRLCNELCDILVGRHVHPISAVIGGFTKLPNLSDLEEMHKRLLELKHDVEVTVELFSKLTFPEFERDTEYLALVNDEDEYPLLYGDIGSTDGYRVSKYEYKNVVNEFVVPYASAKRTKWHRDSYAVGALARFNLNHEKLHPKAKQAANVLNLKPKCINPYFNTVAQIVECVHCVEDAIRIVELLWQRGINYDEIVIPDINELGKLPQRAGEGVGAVEVPRGLLIHHYECDERGILRNANCVIPTNQNTHNIELDMLKLVPEIITQSQEEITLALEMLVRAYDPCISCSVHMVKINFK
ncbi:Ni/Fe hydrogenase subunit alpha [Thermodesulfovibrio sp. 3907-1M]|uniref:Ni/Fe hydrogenase subunit alpha n=1 Tax=Thermodesulfovibrio autotrophicus TaxID=3118333 RepID=A0AAU8GTM0_9BACT